MERRRACGIGALFSLPNDRYGEEVVFVADKLHLVADIRIKRGVNRSPAHTDILGCCDLPVGCGPLALKNDDGRLKLNPKPGMPPYLKLSVAFCDRPEA